jgi:hypothetical protein
MAKGKFKLKCKLNSGVVNRARPLFMYLLHKYSEGNG